MPSHVCLFPGMLRGGGVARNTLNLAEELISRGIRVDLFLTRRAGAFADQIPTGAQVFEGWGSAKASLAPLVRYLRREKPDVLISARAYINCVAVLASRLARSGTRVVITERTAAVTQGRFLAGFRHRILRLGYRLLYPQADHVVAVSRDAAEELAEQAGIERQGINVIYNPVISPRVKSLIAAARSGASAKPPDPVPMILGAGRLTLQKDFEALVRAFALVREELEARLVILGEGEDRPRLEALASDLGIEVDVELPGFVENPYSYMVRADVFVLSSLWEGLPTVLIEALASGTPVIATDCPGGSREILADGVYGELVPVGDVSRLAASIRQAITRPRAWPCLQERAEEFTAARAADRYLTLLS